MKTLINRRSMTILAIAVLVAISTIVSINIWGNYGPITGVANALSRPLQTLASNVANVFESIYSSIYRYDNLMADYEEALISLTRYESAYRESIEIAEENKRLRDLLNFRERNTGYEQIDANIESRSSSNWSSSFTINKGSANSAVEVGDAVVTEYGALIGQVTNVGLATSTVVTVLDTTFSAGAFIGNSNDRVTVKGDFTLMRNGLLRLDYIAEDIMVLPGDSIVTSGYGNVLPPGLYIGEVEDVLRHNTGIGLYATIKPMRDISTITYVYVITDFRVTGSQ